MYTKAELLNLYNMDLDSLLNESKKYLKDEVEFCSIINARNGKCSKLQILRTKFTLQHRNRVLSVDGGK